MAHPALASPPNEIGKGEEFAALQDDALRYEYHVSTYGRVWKAPHTVSFYSDAWEKHVKKRYKGKFLGRTDNGKGYLQCSLRHQQGHQVKKLIHRLVMRVHGPEKPSSDHIDVHHIDGDPKNNRLQNLAWMTPAVNTFQGAAKQVVERHGKETAKQMIDNWFDE